MSDEPALLLQFRVQGTESTEIALRTKLSPFDETYEIEGEHPAEALEKLLQEIEWGILDGWYPFTIEFVGEVEVPLEFEVDVRPETTPRA